MRLAYLAVGIAALVLGSSKGFCGSLFAPFSMESAAVMPKGVSSFRMGGFTTEVSDKYDGFGNIVPLGHSFNKPVTWKELIDTQPAGFERGQFRGGIESFDVDMNDVVGDARGVVNSRVTSSIPMFAYGVTDKLTAAIAVPVLYSNLNVSTGWKANAGFQGTLDDMAQKGFFNKALSYDNDLYNVVATKIAAKGYKPLVDEQHTDIGDVVLGMKYQAFKDSRFAVAVAPRLVVPTGRTADVDKVVDISSGDGQWDVGVGAALDYSPNERATVTYGAAYTYQLPSTKAKRIPTAPDESLSADVDRDVTEKLGEMMSTNLGFRYKVHELWTVGTAYTLQYKSPDSYRGSRYAGTRYQYLEQDTEQLMQAAQVGLSYSTISLFRSGKFGLPLDASISFSSVLSGRNVNKIDLTSVELVSYF